MSEQNQIDVTITGRHMTVGPQLKKHAQDSIQVAQNKYASRPTSAVVTFDRNGSGVECEVSMHLSPGHTAIAKAEASDAHQAFNQSLVKLEKQLRRYKSRLKDHH